MNDITDIIKNLQTLTVDDSAFKILKDFERVLDELDVYVTKTGKTASCCLGQK